MNLKMDTAYVHQTECFQNETAWTEKEIYAYWYNIDTMDQS